AARLVGERAEELDLAMGEAVLDTGHADRAEGPAIPDHGHDEETAEPLGTPDLADPARSIRIALEVCIVDHRRLANDARRWDFVVEAGREPSIERVEPRGGQTMVCRQPDQRAVEAEHLGVEP